MKPVVSCNGPFEIQLDENAEYKLTVGEIASTYPVDACGLDTVYVFPHELDCDHIGLTTVTLAAVGVNGDTAYCQTVVEIFGNRPPNVLPDSAITDENTPVEIDVVANDTDEKTNIDISSQRIVIQPKWGTAVRNPINGVITYTPNRNFNGVDILQYEICDDGIPCDPECGRTYVYIKVNAVNEPPVAEDDYLSADCSSVSQNLLWNDSDPDNDVLTINTNPLVPPQHGVAMIDADGMLNYFPNDGFIGRDSLQYVVCDNGMPSMCDTAWVYIDVDCNEENQNPIECILFVPEGFSPNGDGIHEFFRVMCIHLYPEATMRIFNRNGNLLWMKENYGNYDVWGDAQNAWWWGNTTYRWDQGNRSVPGQEGKLVKVGNYVWVLELGNGEIKNGTVMVAY
jgi:gliding motility-associated-like protein